MIQSIYTNPTTSFLYLATTPIKMYGLSPYNSCYYTLGSSTPDDSDDTYDYMYNNRNERHHCYHQRQQDQQQGSSLNVKRHPYGNSNPTKTGSRLATELETETFIEFPKKKINACHLGIQRNNHPQSSFSKKKRIIPVVDLSESVQEQMINNIAASMKEIPFFENDNNNKNFKHERPSSHQMDIDLINNEEISREYSGQEAPHCPPPSPTLSSNSTLSDSSNSTMYSDNMIMNSNLASIQSSEQKKHEEDKEKEKKSIATQKIQSTFRKYISKKRLLVQLKSLETKFKFLLLSKQDQVFQTPLHYRCIQKQYTTSSPMLQEHPKNNDAKNSSSLVYDANSKIVLGYEQQLMNLLLRLDEIPSFGHLRIKTLRKILIQNIQDELDKLDNYKSEMMRKAVQL